LKYLGPFCWSQLDVTKHFAGLTGLQYITNDPTYGGNVSTPLIDRRVFEDVETDRLWAELLNMDLCNNISFPF
jgi:hypothetical protein